MVSFRKIVICILILSCSTVIWAQQLDQIGKGEALKINGGFNLNQVYKHNSSYHNPDPYAVVATGSLNASLYGWSVPVSFTWSNYQWTYTQPFNQFSLHPSYKWVTAHLGWSSMNFSQWSLSGHSFAGVGVDLTPIENLKISAMYGRLQKATEGDSAYSVLPAYKRMGTGVNVEYNFSKIQVGASVFHAQDDYNSLPSPDADSLGVLPQENLVFAFKSSITPIPSLKVFGEAGLSFLSKDRRISRALDDNNVANAKFLAYKTGLNYNFRLATVGGTYEKVEPGYTTLGAYYSNEDYINYTLDFTTAVWEQKITLAVNTGFRENNLDGKSDNDSKDQINNVQVGFVPNANLSFSAGYSNFYNYSYIKTAFDEVEALNSYELADTLSFTQVNESFNFTGNYNFGDKEKTSYNLMGSFMAQQAGQKQSDNPEHTNTNFYNATLSFMTINTPYAFNWGLTVNYNKSINESGESDMIGPVATVRKSLFDKTLKLSASISYNKRYKDGEEDGQNIVGRFGVNYVLKKKHNFSFSTAMSQRESSTRGTVTNYTASLGYSWSFGWPKAKKEEEKE